MHNIKKNFDKLFNLSKFYLKDYIADASSNFQLYRNKPKMSVCEIISLSLCSEALSIDSENLFCEKLKAEYALDFPNLIDRSNYNKRRRRLHHYIHLLNERMAQPFNEFEDVFIVDSIPIPIVQLAREKCSEICKNDFETAPDKGYSAVRKSYYYGYK